MTEVPKAAAALIASTAQAGGLLLYEFGATTRGSRTATTLVGSYDQSLAVVLNVYANRAL
jgi:hypothetical protein